MSKIKIMDVSIQALDELVDVANQEQHEFTLTIEDMYSIEVLQALFGDFKLVDGLIRCAYLNIECVINNTVVTDVWKGETDHVIVYDFANIYGSTFTLVFAAKDEIGDTLINAYLDKVKAKEWYVKSRESEYFFEERQVVAKAI